MSYTLCIINYTHNIIGDYMITAKVKKWGNSFGVVIPKEELTRMNLQEDQEVILEITKKDSPLKELFGWAKKHKIKKPTAQIIREARKDLGVD